MRCKVTPKYQINLNVNQQEFTVLHDLISSEIAELDPSDEKTFLIDLLAALGD